jgi:Outer membrane protein beta-barrel domain
MRVWLAVGLVMVFANTAHARQDAQLDVSGAAGYATSLHGDLDFGGAAVAATARVRMSAHVALEAQVGYWQHRERATFRTSGKDVVETQTRHAFPSAIVSVVAVSDRHARIGPYGGAGVGMFYHSKRYQQSATSASPAYERSDNRVTLGGELVGGVDVRVANRIKTFGEVRFDIQSFQDPGASSVRVLGGLRVPIG